MYVGDQHKESRPVQKNMNAPSRKNVMLVFTVPYRWETMLALCILPSRPVVKNAPFVYYVYRPIVKNYHSLIFTVSPSRNIVRKLSRLVPSRPATLLTAIIHFLVLPSRPVFIFPHRNK